MKFEENYDLTGQVAIVTGAANGIGHAIAVVLAERGATLAMVDRSETVAEAARALGERHLAFQMDVTDEAAIETMVEDLMQRQGRIDILVNNAGIGRTGPSEALSTKDWHEQLAINLTAPFLLTRAVGGRMKARRYGRIVSMASQAALVGLDGHVGYSATKAGLLGMTRVWALEWGPHGITANAISPTVIETQLAKVHWAGEIGENFRRKIPVGRFGQPEEVAYAVLHLVSKSAGIINGENMVIDGGYTAT
ncbi:D-threitol dehydrogenase [Labrys miyagiensis]|uniref:D-threitol dehydrogenase n=1 Tax=Labrys miyagiensis TaxID=346912 RepID=A0ABQ6CC67_9HYPH|nr:D-threitol dehydrogenase [Labrys miyagiensis]GLS17273.1 D-threitol dehydrogenase [Labrys miyagiensis]